MRNYIAFLRGINVGGHNKLKMAELRSSLEVLGLQNVRTYIQSGNVLFESSNDEDQLAKQISTIVEKDFGISSPVVLRTAEELQNLVSDCPFSEKEIAEADASSKGECLHVAMLEEFPSQEEMDKLLSYANEKEKAVPQGKNIYLLFYDSIRNSKLGNNLNKLGPAVTVRNWKTINKVVSMTEK
ncbi:DUF1697 domain-containing protein [Halobacillus sp. BBL2006]|uniref:DUF1697 domain-containing protein n=1 Tax=Halobacillus sp. BBL2006 TaxID=1543706 RepID=UPI0005440E04|nr:DUF1697 domain-containing protein [Halobacillus sp. BBL2006]KHE71404.1 cytoplasmic protein [Halobacillus sp. BBL2006]